MGLLFSGSYYLFLTPSDWSKNTCHITDNLTTPRCGPQSPEILLHEHIAALHSCAHPSLHLVPAPTLTLLGQTTVVAMPGTTAPLPAGPTVSTLPGTTSQQAGLASVPSADVEDGHSQQDFPPRGPTGKRHKRKQLGADAGAKKLLSLRPEERTWNHEESGQGLRTRKQEEEGWEGTERLVGHEKTEEQTCHVDAGTLRDSEVPTRQAE